MKKRMIAIGMAVLMLLNMVSLSLAEEDFSPEEDASVYDALVRLGQDFAQRYTVITPQGNFGTIAGDPAAAYRYTEAKMAKLAEEMVKDIDKETVDMIPNFDETVKEPTVLPAKFPDPHPFSSPRILKHPAARACSHSAAAAAREYLLRASLYAVSARRRRRGSSRMSVSRACIHASVVFSVSSPFSP